LSPGDTPALLMNFPVISTSEVFVLVDDPPRTFHALWQLHFGGHEDGHSVNFRPMRREQDPFGERQSRPAPSPVEDWGPRRWFTRRKTGGLVCTSDRNSERRCVTFAEVVEGSTIVPWALIFRRGSTACNSLTKLLLSGKNLPILLCHFENRRRSDAMVANALFKCAPSGELT
jgi:hypothetical protein